METLVQQVVDVFGSNHGVTGDWITGYRMLDVLGLGLLVACFLPWIRSVLQRSLYQPAGIRVLTAAAKKTDADLTKQLLQQQLSKWNESCWKLTVYCVFTAAAFLVVWREPYFLDPAQYWTGATAVPCNYFVPLKSTALFSIQAGFYIQAIPYLFFVETRRKDWAESLVHHLVALALIFSAYYCNFTRPAAIVCLLHDVSDISLEAAKLARYAEAKDAAFGWFVAFAVSWVVCRVLIYPYLFVHRFLLDPIMLMADPYDIERQPLFSWFGCIFMLLFMLHLYWTYFILLIIVRQLRTGSTDDIREEDD